MGKAAMTPSCKKVSATTCQAVVHQRTEQEHLQAEGSHPTVLCTAVRQTHWQAAVNAQAELGSVRHRGLTNRLRHELL